uniref:Putative ovule protein n=1 Tax=Solanum chacoense TaxID=4108 RepID=A0A0V0H751_SOLCH
MRSLNYPLKFSKFSRKSTPNITTPSKIPNKMKRKKNHGKMPIVCEEDSVQFVENNTLVILYSLVYFLH